MSNKNLKNQILELSTQGKSYTEIQQILNCSKGTISYHIGNGQKTKSLIRQRLNRKKKHPYAKKLEAFISRSCTKNLTKNQIHKWKKIIQSKIETFCSRKNGERDMYTKPTFTVEDIIKKFGENPKCYLTGQDINIYEPRTYAFDHKIPVSRGGDNSINNLEICTKRANAAKTDMTPEEFIDFCKKVIEYNSKH